MEQTRLNKMMNTILFIFLIIQPIFDLKYFYNSISTLIRVIIIFGLFSYYFLTSKNKRKYWLLLYPCAIGVYFVFHHINALNFTSLVPGNFDYSMLKEGLYFVKMISPFLLIYSLYKAQFSMELIIKIMTILCLIISLTVIITNLIGISYGCYSDIRIKANFFEWFNPNSEYNYKDLASKGLFEFGNQISAILIMFLPFMIYNSLMNKKILSWSVLICNIWGLILLSTRVAVIGTIIVFVYTFSVFIIISLIKKEKVKIKPYIPFCVILICYIVLLPINPMFNRLERNSSIIETFNEEKSTISNNINKENLVTENTISNENITIQEVDSNSNKIEPDDMKKFIQETYKAKRIHKAFLLTHYPYEYDTEFWYDFLQKDISLVMDNRFVERSIVERVVEINNSDLDIWFGITNTRLQNIFNIEKDFVVQYYALGIIGLILVFVPYFILLAIFIYRGLHSKLKNLTIINSLAGITIIFLFGISYMSGNLLNSLSFTIYFTLCFYLLLDKH